MIANKLNIFLFLLVLYVPAKLKAQRLPSHPFTDSIALLSKSVSRICSNDMILYDLRKDPAYRAKEDKMNRDILNRMRRPADDDTIFLPIVVHIINTDPSSITDLQVMNGIDLLNDAFSKSGVYSSSLGVDTKIRFCLAKKDPEGGNSTGITRTTSFFSNFLNMDIEDARLKNLIQWDPSRYINIWLVTSIVGESYADFYCGMWYRLGVGGYASMPPAGGPLDGILLTGFGLLPHEMGHYLGLYHTFEGGCLNNDCLINGDRVCDTPPDGNVRPSAGCSNPDNTCNSDTLSNYSNGFFNTDVPDQISNFMDYGNNACSNQFTQGQADRMKATILTHRSGLLEDECTKPCIEDIIAGFTRNISYPLPGDQITFTNTSSGAANYQWLVDGTVISTTAGFSHSFNATGKYKVTLKAFNTITCFASYTDYVIVTCGVTARFYTDKKTIASKISIYTDSILFTNTSYNAQSFQWLMSNNQGMTEQVISTSTNLTYVFPTPATYRVRLVATNGSCNDTTETYTIPVLDPTPDGVPFNVSLYCYPPNKVRVSFCIADYGFAPIPLNIPVNFYDADPQLPGANKLSPSYYLETEVPGGNCSRCFTHILDVDYYGLEKIYIVFNDTGNTVPVVLPNTYFEEKFYINNTGNSQPVKTIINTAICQGQNYAGYTAAGTYIDTLTSIINGCDSVRTLNLTVKPVAATTVSATICQGQNYAGHTATGTYTDVYAAVNGCDSTRILNLTVLPVSASAITIVICQGENYAGHTTSGTYIDVYPASNGCDSTRTLYLTVNPVFNTTVTASVCQGENYAGHTTSGTYVDGYNTVSGCDSTRTLYLTVNPTVSSNVAAAICQDDNYAGHTTPGTYVDVYTAVNGCDSTRTLQLTVKPKSFTTIDTTICKGESYLAGGYLQTITGIYTDTSLNYLGCDSIITTSLTVNFASPDLGNDKGICFGDVLTLNPGTFVSYLWHDSSTGSTYTTDSVGQYAVLVTNNFGCKASDTIQVLTIYPLPVNFLPADTILCTDKVMQVNIPGYINYLWSTGSDKNFVDIINPGIYSLMVTDSNGCKGTDSIRILHDKCDGIPNAFTPNDDGLNDVFRPVFPGTVLNYRLQIWNRWGLLVFESHNSAIGWDGTYKSVAQPTAVYVYIITFKNINGADVMKKGIVTLLR